MKFTNTSKCSWKYGTQLLYFQGGLRKGLSQQIKGLSQVNVHSKSKFFRQSWKSQPCTILAPIPWYCAKKKRKKGPCCWPWPCKLNIDSWTDTSSLVIAPLCVFYLYIDSTSQSPLVTLFLPLQGQNPWFGEGVENVQAHQNSE